MSRGARHLVLKALALAVAVLVALPLCAIETVRWERLPLSVPLLVGQERVVFIDRNVRVGVADELNDRLQVQSAGGAVYLRASSAFEPTRVQIQDTETGALILLDVSARAAKPGESSAEPLRIVFAGPPAQSASSEHGAHSSEDRRSAPHAVVLTRYAAQSLYAPLRTVEPVAGITRTPLARHVALDTLCPLWPVRARALAAWHLEDEWVTAILLTNISGVEIALDPRALEGDFVAATFQHVTLGAAGDPRDTTVLYLVTRGHGLAESLLPNVSPIDPSLNLPASRSHQERRP